MIEKIDHADIVPRELLVSKINELVEAVNKLGKLHNEFVNSIWNTNSVDPKHPMYTYAQIWRDKLLITDD